MLQVSSFGFRALSFERRVLSFILISESEKGTLKELDKANGL